MLDALRHYAWHISRPPIAFDLGGNGDDDRIKRWWESLTPEERERLVATLRSIFKRMSEAMVPKIDFSGIAKADAIASAALRNIKMPSQSVIRSLMESQKTWQRQSVVINSDALRVVTQMQDQMRILTANLTKNIDFGLGKAAADLAKSFTAQQTALWKSLEPSLRQITRAFYPPNLRDIDHLDFDEVRAVVLLDGIALYGVPRASIAQSILNADTAAKKRAVLGRKRPEIAADCRSAAASVTSTRLAPYARMLAVSLDALDADQFAASQALTSNVFDSLIFERWGEKKQTEWAKFLPDRNGKRTDGVEMALHDYLATAPIKQAFQHFDRAAKATTPRDTYSRHATAHTVSGRQYSRRNAVQAAMAVASLLLFLEERETRSWVGKQAM